MIKMIFFYEDVIKDEIICFIAIINQVFTVILMLYIKLQINVDRSIMVVWNSILLKLN